MPFYEVIYETGAHSIAEFDSDDVAIHAISAHQERAVNGIAGGPTGHPAERVVKVLKYAEHPVDYNIMQLVPTDEAKKVIDAYDLGGEISIPQIAAKVRELISPVIEDGGPHDTSYKMPDIGSIDPSKWQAA